ncbi:MAG: hypothetical protein AAGB11_03830 [Pseudomonadota bacterium]
MNLFGFGDDSFNLIPELGNEELSDSDVADLAAAAAQEEESGDEQAEAPQADEREVASSEETRETITETLLSADDSIPFQLRPDFPSGVGEKAGTSVHVKLPGDAGFILSGGVNSAGPITPNFIVPEADASNIGTVIEDAFNKPFPVGEPALELTVTVNTYAELLGIPGFPPELPELV